MQNILLNRITGYVLVVLLTLAGEVFAAETTQEKIVVLALGDSLTAGFGVDTEENFPSRLQVKIDNAGLAYKVVNAGVSGDTTAGGVRRINWLMKHKQIGRASCRERV